MGILDNDGGADGDEAPQPIAVPFESLSRAAQEGVLNDFIYREGTDYGAVEASLAKKQNDLLRQIERGDVVLIFDPAMESVTLVTAREWKKIQSAQTV